LLPAVKEQLEGGSKAATALAERLRLSEETGARVVFVVTQSGNHANGGVESITQVLEHLRRVRPLVVTQMETRINRRWRDAGCEVLIWSMPAPRPTSLVRTNQLMFKLLRSTGCRIVHCNDILALWHTAFGARMAGARVVFNVRNIKQGTARYGWRWHVARRISDRQLVLSKEMRAALASRLGLKDSSAGANARTIEYIYSAVDPLSLSPMMGIERAALRARLGIAAECFAIGIVAAFEPRKAQLDFITECVPHLKRLLPQARIFFVGDFNPEGNDYARRCQSAVEALGLGKSVSFTGYQSEMNQWYRALDLLVVASRNEGLARCMIESLACGTPVVSFDVCSAREILEEGGCGVVVPQGDFKSLVERLAALAGAPTVRERFGVRGAALARELFEPREIVSRYEQLYLSLIRE
jgi:glycosyltransferase involved in cell wall biosynthesis